MASALPALTTHALFFSLCTGKQENKTLVTNTSLRQQTQNMMMPSHPYREIRAAFDEETIRVYQAYNQSIASQAVIKQCFTGINGFKLSRATWIKPSFCWMAYRSGYSLKDVNQERILAIDLRRPAFETMLADAVINKVKLLNTGGDVAVNYREADVVVQWDPERDIAINRLPYRSIQIGLKYDAAIAFARGDPIHRISDVTDVFLRIKTLLDEGQRDHAELLLPEERPYPLPEAIRDHLQMNDEDSTAHLVEALVGTLEKCS